MKIRITTEREILDNEFWLWIRELKRNGVPVDGERLLSFGHWEFSTDLGYTKAKTIYEIERGKAKL